MTQNDPSRVAAIAASLTDLERELITGSSPHLGSWMWMVGSDLVAKGLGTKRGGSIQFDTPLGLAVRAHLREPRP